MTFYKTTISFSLSPSLFPSLSTYLPLPAIANIYPAQTTYLLPTTYHIYPYSTYLAQPNYPADDDDNYTQVISLARYPADDDDNHLKNLGGMYVANNK